MLGTVIELEMLLNKKKPVNNILLDVGKTGTF